MDFSYDEEGVDKYRQMRWIPELINSDGFDESD